MSYHAEYTQSIENPEAFWAEKAADLPWFKQPETILSKDENGIDRWFADGEMNTAYMALDHHVETGRADQIAVIYDSPVSNTKRQLTYREMRDQVALFAGVLKAQGVEKGDRVVIYMPMVPEALIAMYAVAGWVRSIPWSLAALRPMSWRCVSMTPSPRWW